MWGQGYFSAACHCVHRIIPTRVGTSERSLNRNSKNRDHPHACGDKNMGSMHLDGTSGSSPRVWGQEVCFLCDELSEGIIPTRVGTSLLYLPIYYTVQDHPHACGDKVNFKFGFSDSLGSSPRVWGQDAHFSDFHLHLRIIPTRVGTSPMTLPFLSVLKDHPHACGDKKCFHLILSTRIGSSPRVWGQGKCIAISKITTRIIPTRVGTSR